METMETESHAADVVDRLWRAYAPFQRGRNTFDDLTSMLAILVLAGFVESVGEPEDEFVKRWARAVAEARIGISPLMDLRAAMRSARRHARFPVFGTRSLDVGLLDSDEESGDVPWVAAFLTALNQRPAPAEAGFAEVCELLLERHVQEGTFSAGEFYTPREVARLLIESASPQPGDRILDPACGSGGLLAAAAQRIAESGRVDGSSFEAYATDSSNPRLAMMNLAIHGVDQPVVGASDPVSLFQSRGHGLADRVLSNPPFNQRIEDIGIVDWPFGRPPKSNANFAWLQLAWTRLSENGTAAMIMPPGVAWANGREAEIRRRMIAAGALLAIIALPPNLFTHTSIPVHIWLLARDKSRHLPAGDANAVLFIDAGRLGTQVPRQPRVLTPADRQRISSRFHAWQRSPRATPDEPGFSRSVTHEEILENDGNLDPRLYVDAEQERPTTALDMSRMLDELDRHVEATSSSRVGLRKSFSMCERLTRSGIEPPRVPLRSIMNGTAEGVFQDSTSGLLLAGPSGSLIRAEDYVDGGGVPVVMPKDLTGSGFSVASIRYITEQQAESLERFRLRRGDVVLARRGELGRCAVVREEQQGWVCGTGCFVLRPPAELNADYLAAYLRSPEARKWLEAHSTGSMTMKTISLNVLGELPVVLPDLGTQQAIAGAMARLDEQERLLLEQLALTQKIRSEALNGILSS
ncbi:type I restriction enzyme M protein [Streptomyces puniciscabiei]|uniref:site-specific DNA-methyltransferase (adenine-specific) n=2 Tax=Streptomyces puniciscabiei TaxID=164348 RepID=A0A542UEL8_9ACTN|nr:type I restriction enzyme M protein [Streptomyces puniciscabiei]